MKILISGSSGLIGKKLTDSLSGDGHELSYLVRKNSGSSKGNLIAWEPENTDFKLDPKLIEPFGSVINLAGEPVFSLRWSDDKKARIRNSRVNGTRIIAEAMTQAENFNGSFICASATGYYGNRGNTELNEESSSGEGFLPSVCEDWEAAAQTAADKGIRTVNARIGVVLSRNGGALKTMLPAFRIGIGGRMGSGEQYMSWIDIDDIVDAFKFLILKDSISGPVNMVSPNPLTNKEFTSILANKLGKVAAIPVPSFFLKLVGGQMAEEMLLSSTKAIPTKLLKYGYQFSYKTLDVSFNHLL